MKTFQAILEDLNEKRRMSFSSDPEREEIMRAATTLALVSLLERLSESERQQLDAQRNAVTVAG